MLPACIHLDFATTPRGHRAAVAALAVLVRRDLLEVIAAKRHDAGVADLDEPIVIDKRSTRGTSACHLLGEGETERALLPADLEDAAGRHAEHEQGQEPPYEQEQERDEHEQARTLVGEDRHEGEDEREDEGHAVENNRQRLDGRPTQARLGHGTVDGVRDFDALFLQTGEEVERAHPLEAYRAELPVALEQVDPHHLRVKRCTGDVAKRRLLADAEGVTRENAPTVHVDTRDAQQGPDSHTRERHGMTEPHKFVVPLAQRDALPDVDTQHEQFERDGAAGDDRADGCGHAHREAIEAVRCLAALARAAAGDPCSERADDEHGHTDAQNGFEQITHRGHRLGLWRLTAGNAARTMGCAQRKEPRIGKRRHRNRPANR